MPFSKAKQFALAIGAAATFSFAAPASAVDIAAQPSASAAVTLLGDMTYEHKRKKWKHRHYHNDHYYDRRGHYRGERVYRDTRIWRGRDGRYYCRKENGTTGLLIGAGVGALAGHEIAGRGDRTLGAILGAAGGAILGRAIDRSNSRCR